MWFRLSGDGEQVRNAILCLCFGGFCCCGAACRVVNRVMSGYDGFYISAAGSDTCSQHHGKRLCLCLNSALPCEEGKFEPRKSGDAHADYPG